MKKSHLKKLFGEGLINLGMVGIGWFLLLFSCMSPEITTNVYRFDYVKIEGKNDLMFLPGCWVISEDTATLFYDKYGPDIPVRKLAISRPTNESITGKIVWSFDGNLLEYHHGRNVIVIKKILRDEGGVYHKKQISFLVKKIF
jgi:hypothetical protein